MHRNNKFHYILFFIILNCTIAAVTAQPVFNSKEYNKIKTDSALIHLQKLKQGALLVELSDKRLQQQKLIANGKFKTAESIKRKQMRINKAIIESFRKKFNFCPVYFFYASSADSINSNLINNIAFINDSLNYDKSIRLSTTKDYYIASFTSLKSASLGVSALVIMDKNFDPLNWPFPYYVRTYQSLFGLRKKTIDNSVAVMDKQLHQFKFIGSFTPLD